MNFTSHIILYLGFFQHFKWKDKLCLVAFSWKYMVVLFHFFYFNKINLKLHFESREFLSLFLPAGKRYGITSSIPWPFEIVISAHTDKTTIVLSFLASTSWLWKLPSKTGKKIHPNWLAVLSNLSYKNPLKTIDITMYLTLEHQSNITIIEKDL